MDRIVRILAIVYRDACHDTSNNVWPIHNEMIIELIFGIALAVFGGDSAKADPAGMVLKGIMQGNKIIQKEKNKETDDSIHEELHIMTKDYIYKLGRK